MGNGRDLGAGLASATAQALEAWRDPEADRRAQPSLFGSEPPEADSAGALDLDAAPERRGPGRPPGARNRSTEQWTRYLLSRYRSPLLALAEIAQAHPHRLAAELSEGLPSTEAVTPAEALRIIMQAAQALAPYLHQRQPQALDTGGAGLLVVQIGDIGGAEVGGGVSIQPIEEIEENQQVNGTPEGGTE